MPSAFTTFLDAQLFSGSGSDTAAPAKELLAGKKCVALYFNPVWSKSTEFTDIFVKAYSGAAARDSSLVEAVYVSVDRNEDDFNEHRKKQPWPALPPSGELTAALRKEYQVEYFPSVVIVDATTGQMRQPDAVQDVTMDPQGVNAPWIPVAQRPHEVMTDGVPLRGDHTVTGATCIGDLRAKGVREVGVYFGAYMLGECRPFTSALAAVYKKWKESGKQDKEIVFVTGDVAEHMANRLQVMTNFAMVPFGTPHILALTKAFAVRQTPLLVTLRLGATATDPIEIINPNATDALRENPEGFPWPA